jgi:prepilin-type N-terminal cleavage/methylation domain-containing protein
MFKRRNGFSLTEILVVMAIIAVLFTVSVFMLRINRQKTRDAKRVSDIRQIQVALEMHYNDENRYPSQIQTGAPIAGETTGIVYMMSVPADPLGTGEYIYQYNSESPYDSYAISFRLERGIGELAKGPHTVTAGE